MKEGLLWGLIICVSLIVICAGDETPVGLESFQHQPIDSFTRFINENKNLSSMNKVSNLPREAEAGVLLRNRFGSGLKDDGIQDFTNKFRSIGSVTKPGFFLSDDDSGYAIVTKPSTDILKKHSTFFIAEGLANTDAVSIQPIMLDGWYFKQLGENIKTKDGKNVDDTDKTFELILENVEVGRTVQEDSMTWWVRPPLNPKLKLEEGWMSLESLNRPGWFIIERDFKLKLVFKPDPKTSKAEVTADFNETASFRVELPLFYPCPQAEDKRMCSDRGQCVDIKSGTGICKCAAAFKGDACEVSVLKIKISPSSAPFDYQGQNGPDNWYKLGKDNQWQTCKSGKIQSPIKFPEKLSDMHDLTESEYFGMHYQQSSFNIVRNGKDMRIEFSTVDASLKNYIRVNGKSYFLRYALLHAPGEHMISVKHNNVCADKFCPFDMELQFYHEGDDKTIVAVAVPFSMSLLKNDFMDKIIRYMPKTNSNGSSGNDSVHLFYEMPENPVYYRYSGSVTVPPCTEGVTWYVFGDPLLVTSAQVQAIYDLNEGLNARSLQPDNGRPIDAAFTLFKNYQYLQDREIDSTPQGVFSSFHSQENDDSSKGKVGIGRMSKISN